MRDVIDDQNSFERTLPAHSQRASLKLRSHFDCQIASCFTGTSGPAARVLVRLSTNARYMNSTNAPTPRLKTKSPGTLIQTKACMIELCMNSADRASP